MCSYRQGHLTLAPTGQKKMVVEERGEDGLGGGRFVSQRKRRGQSITKQVHMQNLILSHTILLLLYK